MARRSLGCGLAALIALLAAPAWGDTLYLRQSCSGLPGGAFCRTALLDILTEVAARTPTAANPLLVDIGEGTFAMPSHTPTGPFYCSGKSHLTFRGAGPRATVLTGGAYYSGPSLPSPPAGRRYVVKISGCSRLAFQDLAIRSDIAAAVSTDSGVLFTGDTGTDASTTWTNVEITAQRVGVRDENATSAAASVHYWYDGEIEVAEESPPPGSVPTLVALQSTNASYRIIGTLLAAKGGAPRAVQVTGPHAISLTAVTLEAKTTRNGGAFGLSVSGSCGTGSTLTLSGSDLTASSDFAGQFAYGASVQCGDTMIHGTRFDVQADERVRTFSSGAGKLTSPYSLGSGATPPALPIVTIPWSTPGQDQFIETDCAASCASSGTQQHLLVFNASECPAAGWYDTHAGACR